MEIFGRHIFGDDAKAWLKLCKEQKKEWILRYTNQKNETLIDEFINNPNISKECKCLNCGKNGNKSIGISKTTTEGVENNGTKGVSSRRTTKRGKNAKNT
jgi:hypothetical protein